LLPNELSNAARKTIGVVTKNAVSTATRTTGLPNEVSTATRTTTEEKDEDEEDITDFIW
jgi:hypothetical protein